MRPTPLQQHPINSIAADCLSVRLRLLNRLVGAIYDEALRPHGIKASQLNILVAVSAAGSVTSGELCRALHMDPSTFSRALARLKKNGWLWVEPSGQGKILKVTATAKGYQKIELAYPAWQQAQARAVEALGQSTAEMLVSSANRHLVAGMNQPASAFPAACSPAVGGISERN